MACRRKRLLLQWESVIGWNWMIHNIRLDGWNETDVRYNENAYKKLGWERQGRTLSRLTAQKTHDKAQPTRRWMHPQHFRNAWLLVWMIFVLRKGLNKKSIVLCRDDDDEKKRCCMFIWKGIKWIGEHFLTKAMFCSHPQREIQWWYKDARVSLHYVGMIFLTWWIVFQCSCKSILDMPSPAFKPSVLGLSLPNSWK